MPAYNKPRASYLRRRPRPGALVRAPEDLPLPHERDQLEEGMTDGTPTAEGRLGQADVRRGVRDTSKAEEMDRTYQRQK